MAAITVTSAQTNDILNGNRVCVRTSAGIPYVIVCDSTDDSIEVWKGDGTTPTAFTEQDSANNPDNTTYGSMSAAIDSAGIIHIVFCQYVSKSDDLEYITFNTATDLFGSQAAINTDLGAESTAITNLYTSIAIDSNDIPHVAYTGVEASAGTTGFVTRYENRIGGAWIGTGVEVEGQTGNKDCYQPSITIDADNKPVITYTNADDDDYGAAIGNANDATSFTLFDYETDAETLTIMSTTSVCVDPLGNHWFAYRQETNALIQLRKHNYGTTWDATGFDAELNSAIAGIVGSVVANGTDIYIFYEDTVGDTEDIKYLLYNGSWSAETALETGTFNTVKAKWAFRGNNDSGGELVESSETYTTSYPFGSSVNIQKVAQAFQVSRAGTIKSVVLKLEKTGTPTDNLEVSIRSTLDGAVLGNTVTLDMSLLTTEILSYLFDNLNAPVSASTTYYIQLQRSGDLGAINYPMISYTDANPYANGSLWRLNTGGWGDLGYDTYFIISMQQTELDYAFTDETATPDIWWNKLSLVTPSVWTPGGKVKNII